MFRFMFVEVAGPASASLLRAPMLELSPDTSTELMKMKTLVLGRGSRS